MYEQDAPRLVRAETWVPVRRIRDDRGQVSILMVAVIGLIAAVVVGIGMVGHALVGRAQARTAADAVALATVRDLAAGEDLAIWYRDRGLEIDLSPGQAYARAGPSQAQAWAALVADDRPEIAPVLVAIVARIGQVVGSEIEPIVWTADTMTLIGADAAAVAAVASEFGLCADGATGATPTGTERYRLC